MAITTRRNAGKDIANPVHAPAPVVKKSSKLKNWLIGLLILLIIGIFIGAYMMGKNSATMPVTHITNAFVDVNGDGKPDLILNADVILNNGQVSFPISRP